MTNPLLQHKLAALRGCIQTALVGLERLPSEHKDVSADDYWRLNRAVIAGMRLQDALDALDAAQGPAREGV